MYNQLYPYMQWPEIEALAYSEHNRPHNILGQRVVDGRLLIATYSPDAKYIEVKNLEDKQTYPMVKMDDCGYYAVLLDSDKKIKYKYVITYQNDVTVEQYDPYAFDSQIDADDIMKFNAGINYEVYNVLGAHVRKVDGVEGVLFAVWAPEAVRVSVVGDFNNWDGRRHPMECLGESGIHELFIPGLKALEKYKYEVKVKNQNTVILKADPYGVYSEVRPNTASVVYDIDRYKWHDSKWLRNRKKLDNGMPMNIYEVHLGGFKRPDEEDGRTFYNYRELAVMITDYVKEMGYTHVELMPIMEHPLDASWGYQVTGYYAPTSRYGTPDDFMYMMDYFHQNDIGVILDWVPAHFPKDMFGLARFDGSCVYEHADPRQGEHPHWGTLIFNYGRPEVSNFLIANALYWVEKYHADGIRMDAVASMLYLDYGKNDGEWVANIYGGKENLEAMEFLKHLNSIMSKRNEGVMMIAEESTAWAGVTKDVEEGGLGFNYKWNMGWMNDFLRYMELDPYFRSYHYNELLFSMIYAYSEHFVLVLSHDEVVHGKGSMIGKMPGEYDDKFSNLRVAYGYMMGHPGKKLLFMGQEYAQFSEFDENKSLEWFMLDNERHKQMQDYVKDLNHLYLEHPAFYKLDSYPEGFTWINCISPDESIVTFVRKTENENETMLLVCNFTPVVREKYRIGVPFKGKFKEILNSDAVKYGGKGNVNPRMKQSKAVECDGYDNSIEITVPPLGCAVFTCTKLEEARKTKSPKTTTKTAKNAETTKASLEKVLKADVKEAKKAATKKTTVKKVAEEKTEVKSVDKVANPVVEAEKTVLAKDTKTEEKQEEKREENATVEDKVENQEIDKVVEAAQDAVKVAVSEPVEPMNTKTADTKADKAAKTGSKKKDRSARRKGRR